MQILQHLKYLIMSLYVLWFWSLCFTDLCGQNQTWYKLKFLVFLFYNVIVEDLHADM